MALTSITRYGINPGSVGILTFELDRQPMSLVCEEIAELEDLGYGTLWVPEVDNSRDPLTTATLLLAATARLVVATGIIRVRERSARSVAAAHRTLDEVYPGRFILGLGGPPQVERPVAAMGAYLDTLDATALASPAPGSGGARLIAAYGPVMMRLAGERSAGAQTAVVSAQHTREARTILGPTPFLAVEHAVVVESDAARARMVAREHLAFYLRSPYNLAKFRRLGYQDADFAQGGSDALVDDLVAWGNVQQIGDKLAKHFEAGADHVAVQALGVPGGLSVREQWHLLVPLLQRFATPDGPG